MVSSIKNKYFRNVGDSIISLVFISVFSYFAFSFIDWLFIKATFSGDSDVCREGAGACWPFILEKGTFILFGVYPREYLWRPILGMILLTGFWFHFQQKNNWNQKLFIKLISVFFLYWLLLRGVGEAFVSTDKWGGLPLTLLLAGVGIIFSYPLGIILALARYSGKGVIKLMAIVYIELIRGVPLISLLFMASVLIPLFLPSGLTIQKLLRAQLAIILFSAAYFAEVIRGGLQGIGKGQWEGGKSLGMNYLQLVRFIILPQALVKVIPPTVNTVIGMFKDTSLVIIIALFDLMGTTKASMTDMDWMGFSLEAYLMAAVIYYVICSSMGNFSSRLEVEFQKGKGN